MNVITAKLLNLGSNIFVPRKFISKVDVYVDNGSCYVELQGKRDKDNLIKLFAFFLARFLYIADSKQKNPMSALLVHYFDRTIPDFTNLMEATESMIFNEMNKKERESMAQVFRKGFAGKIPPILLSNKPVVPVWGKYEFSIYENNGIVKSHMKMPSAYDKIIYPRVLIILLYYIEKEIKDKKAINELYSALTQVMIHGSRLHDSPRLLLLPNDFLKTKHKR